MRLAKVAGVVAIVSVASLTGLWLLTLSLKMPDHNYSLPIAALSGADTLLSGELRAHVDQLATVIGPRNRAFYPNNLNQAATYIDGQLTSYGYAVESQEFTANDDITRNLVAIRRGVEPELIIIGAHYDSYGNSPGADDNASGVAVLLALAKRLALHTPQRTLRFVAYTNEEPPDYKTARMGSLVDADRLAESGQKISAMLSLETIGFYSAAPKSQEYPFPLNLFLYDIGDFIGVVGNMASQPLMRQFSTGFRQSTNFPLGGISLPQWVPGVDWSDQWRFWQKNVPALMITDSALYRYPYYHTPQDTADRLDYLALAQVALGLQLAVAQLAQGE